MDDARQVAVDGGDAMDRLMLAAAAILEGLPDAVVAATRDRRILFVNALAEQLFGYPRAEVLGKPVDVLWPPRVRERYARNMEFYFETEHPMRFSSESWGLRRDGSEFVGEMSWGIVETTAGPLLLAVGRDVSQRRAAEERVRAVAAIGERALAGTDPAALTAEAVELLRTTLPLDGAALRLADGTLLATTGDATPASIVLPIGTGDELLVAPARALADEEMSHVRAVANTLAIALARLRDEERVRHEAGHDPLTGLANRTLLQHHLEKSLARSKRERTATGVLFVDLDNFKEVNDVHGHAAGDAVLSKIGARLRTAIRPADMVARIGGDEFVVVCDDVDEASALMLSERLLEAVGTPLTLGEVGYAPSACVGIALGCDHADVLLERSDVACYRAKAKGHGRVEVSR
jgi:diguanylate cyclase (GGDEF)-like protein/PAS domain S-box-containing protein